MTTIDDLLRSRTAGDGSGHTAVATGRADLAEHVLLTTQEAAVLTTYSPHSLENLRPAGRGPAFIKVKGGAVAYRLCDLLSWQQSHRVSTIDQLQSWRRPQ